MFCSQTPAWHSGFPTIFQNRHHFVVSAFLLSKSLSTHLALPLSLFMLVSLSYSNLCMASTFDVLIYVHVEAMYEVQGRKRWNSAVTIIPGWANTVWLCLTLGIFLLWVQWSFNQSSTKPKVLKIRFWNLSKLLSEFRLVCYQLLHKLNLCIIFNWTSFGASANRHMLIYDSMACTMFMAP